MKIAKNKNYWMSFELKNFDDKQEIGEKKKKRVNLNTCQNIYCFLRLGSFELKSIGWVRIKRFLRP